MSLKINGYGGGGGQWITEREYQRLISGKKRYSDKYCQWIVVCNKCNDILGGYTFGDQRYVACEDCNTGSENCIFWHNDTGIFKSSYATICEECFSKIHIGVGSRQKPITQEPAVAEKKETDEKEAPQLDKVA